MTLVNYGVTGFDGRTDQKNGVNFYKLLINTGRIKASIFSQREITVILGAIDRTRRPDNALGRKHSLRYADYSETKTWPLKSLIYCMNIAKSSPKKIRGSADYREASYLVEEV